MKTNNTPLRMFARCLIDRIPAYVMSLRDWVVSLAAVFFGFHATLPQKNFWGALRDTQKTVARETRDWEIQNFFTRAAETNGPLKYTYEIIIIRLTHKTFCKLLCKLERTNVTANWDCAVTVAMQNNEKTRREISVIRMVHCCFHPRNV